MLYHQHTKGFTLVETLVAVSILLIAIIGPMTLASQGVRTATFAREQTVAIFLAQEAIESFEYLRDEAALTAEYGGGTYWGWYDALPAACKSATACDFDVIADTYHACTTESDCLLQKHSDPDSNDNIIYGYGSGSDWSDSPYTRKITLSETQADREATVTVEVSWDSSFGDDVSIVLQTHIFNQYE